jgi:hypothetical protein
MGRRAHRPDAFHRRQVEAMAGYGVPEHAIARVVGIDPKTLRRHYREELDTGQYKATAKVAESLAVDGILGRSRTLTTGVRLGQRERRALLTTSPKDRDPPGPEASVGVRCWEGRRARIRCVHLL